MFMFEFWGYDMMFGLILYLFISDEVDVFIIFVEIFGCFFMCGYGMIGMIIMVLENGYIMLKDCNWVVLDVLVGFV